MSLRQNAYHSGGGRRLSTGVGDDDVGWLWKLLGMDKTEGGPTVDPTTGRITYTPYEGKNFISRRIAGRQNDALLPLLLGNQLQSDSAMALEKERQKGNLAIEGARTKGDIRQERVRGKQSRKTAEFTAQEARKTQEEGSKQRITEEKLKQAAEVLSKAGVAYDEKSLADYISNVNPQKIAKEESRSRLENMVLGDEEYKKDYLEGQRAQARSPIGELAKNLRLEAGPGQTTVQPNWTGKGSPDILTGPVVNPDVMAMTGGFPIPDPENKGKFIMVEQKPEIMRGGMTPGRFTPGSQADEAIRLQQLFRSRQGISKGEEGMQEDTSTSPGLSLGITPPPASSQPTGAGNLLSSPTSNTVPMDLTQQLNSPYLMDRIRAKEKLRQLGFDY